jgi:hypothetical protein
MRVISTLQQMSNIIQKQFKWEVSKCYHVIRSQFDVHNIFFRRKKSENQNFNKACFFNLYCMLSR